MPWAYLGVTLFGAALVVVAHRPPRSPAWGAPSFVAGSLIGELPLQHVGWQALATVAFAFGGALGSWPGWAGLAVAVVGWCGLLHLAWVGHRTGRVSARALQAAAGGPLPALPEPAHLEWFSWWRLALAVPLRGSALERIKDIDYAGDGIRRHRLDVVRSRHPGGGRPVLVQIHGGAWIMGDKREQGRPLMYELASRGWICVAINYRLSPRATWPDHVVDCKRAISWVRSHIGDFGGDPSFVAVTGGSAGGHLAALLALTAGDRGWQPGFEDADTSVQACVPCYGVFDMTGQLGGSARYGSGLVKMLERAVMKTPMASHRELFEQASPTLRVHAEAPPFLVLHGANDTLVPPEVARRFVETLTQVARAPVAYVELPLAQHAYDVLASLRCRGAVSASVAFLQAMWQRHLGRGPWPGTGARPAAGCR